MCYGSDLDVEDLAQEVYMKALKRSDTFEGNSQLWTWLYSIARNTVIDALRKRKNQRLVLASRELDFEHDSANEDEAPLERRERIQLLRNALSGLPIDQQEIIRMKDFDDLSYQNLSYE